MVTASSMTALIFTVQFVALCFLSVDGYKPRHLVASSVFAKRALRQLAFGQVLNHVSLSIHCISSLSHSACSILSVRGGAYKDHNDGYVYNDDNGYNDDYLHNDYGQGKSYSGQNGRYQEDYYPRQVRGDGFYDDEGRYHEDYDSEGAGRSQRKKTSLSSPSKLPRVLTSGNRKLGIIFLSSGAAFTALGITLFFNKTLMRLGNLLFVSGIPLMIGPGRTLGYFLQPKKARATGCLMCGIFLVLVGHPVIGILLEVFGLLNLFGNMFPVLMIMAKNLPVVGNLFEGNRSSSRQRERRSRDDEYYNDGYGDDGGYGREPDDWNKY